MRAFTVTVRVVPCPHCDRRNRIGDPDACRTCGGRGEVVATSERLLVGLRLMWDSFR